MVRNGNPEIPNRNRQRKTERRYFPRNRVQQLLMQKISIIFAESKQRQKAILQGVPSHHVQAARPIMLERVEIVPVTLDHDVPSHRMPRQMDEPKSPTRLARPDKERGIIGSTSRTSQTISQEPLSQCSTTSTMLQVNEIANIRLT